MKGKQTSRVPNVHQPGESDMSVRAGEMTTPPLRRARTVRRLAAGTVLIGLLLGSGWFALHDVNLSAVKVGGALPAIEYTRIDGQRGVVSGRQVRTIVLLVHSQCGHCDYQLQMLDREVSRLRNTRLYVLATESAFFTDDQLARLPRLSTSPSIFMGVVDRASFERELGVLVTPALFVFDRHGRLTKSFRGETKIEALIDSNE